MGRSLTERCQPAGLVDVHHRDHEQDDHSAGRMEQIAPELGHGQVSSAPDRSVSRAS